MLIKKPFYKGLLRLFLLNLCEFQEVLIMRKKTLSIFILIFLFAIDLRLLVRKLLIQTDADNLYKNGIELFDKEKFGAAQEQFNRL